MPTAGSDCGWLFQSLPYNDLPWQAAACPVASEFDADAAGLDAEGAFEQRIWKFLLPLQRPEVGRVDELHGQFARADEAGDVVEKRFLLRSAGFEARLQAVFEAEHRADLGGFGGIRCDGRREAKEQGGEDESVERHG